MSPEPNAAGWNREDVTVALSATDAGVGVQEIHVLVEDQGGTTPPSALIEPGDTVVLPAMSAEGVHRVTYWAVDRLGNTEQPRVLEVRIDRTSPTLTGLPSQPCTLWPPDRRMVQVAQVTGADALSGVAGVQVAVTADEPTGPDDIRVDGGTVEVRASRNGRGSAAPTSSRPSSPTRPGTPPLAKPSAPCLTTNAADPRRRSPALSSHPAGRVAR